MSYSKFIRTNDPVPARVPEKLARRHVSETAALVKVSAARKQATEAKAEPITATNYHDHVHSGSSGESQSLPPIPKWATMFGSVAMQVASQLLHLGREPDPPTPTKPVAPPEWVANTDAPEFCAIAAEALGVLWRPSLAHLTDFHRHASPFHRAAMEKRIFYFENVPLVCFSKAGLLELCRHKANEILSLPKLESPATSPSPPLRPSAADLAQERVDMAAARRSPAEIVQRENAAYLAARQAEEAAAQQAAKGA